LLIQFIKFGLVGISNTVITAVVIWLMLKIFGLNDLSANIIGYIAGLTNSFIWNRKWTFRSKSKIKDTVFKFILIFVISYLLQLGVLFLLLNSLQIDAYWCHLIAMAVYTLVNFVLNKFYTFKTNSK
jgi:putative flippase GtrA